MTLNLFDWLVYGTPHPASYIGVLALVAFGAYFSRSVYVGLAVGLMGYSAHEISWWLFWLPAHVSEWPYFVAGTALYLGPFLFFSTYVLLRLSPIKGRWLLYSWMILMSYMFVWSLDGFHTTYDYVGGFTQYADVLSVNLTEIVSWWLWLGSLFICCWKGLRGKHRRNEGVPVVTPQAVRLRYSSSHGVRWLNRRLLQVVVC